MTNKEIAKYLGITFGLSWGLWGISIVLTQVLGFSFSSPFVFVPFVLGTLCPAVSALWVCKRNHTKDEFGAFVKNIFCFRHPLKWYLFILLSVLLISASKAWATSRFSGLTFQMPLYFVFIMIPVMIVGGGIEEVGWRGFLQPRMANKYSALAGTLFVGIIWTIWHIPLWFIVGSNQSSMNFVSFALSALSYSYLLAIIYDGTRSTFMCILTHAFINSCEGVFGWSKSPDAVLGAAVMLVITILLFIGYSFIYKPCVAQKNAGKPPQIPH